MLSPTPVYYDAEDQVTTDPGEAAYTVYGSTRILADGTRELLDATGSWQSIKTILDTPPPEVP